MCIFGRCCFCTASRGRQMMVFECAETSNCAPQESVFARSTGLGMATVKVIPQRAQSSFILAKLLKQLRQYCVLLALMAILFSCFTRWVPTGVWRWRIRCEIFAMCCSVLQCVAVCCSVLQCVAVCCSVACFS